ncbi:DUF4407 domain-containing protein [Nonomuraea gerenzanensis]|uniref:DUF4407 domain-containing protein n=1 Tax=Nonomuraea gerenzanensis TaxID=93944 RepID=A0A1M4EM99_9ACTN|nr:DUF4407 domain-containing protein [Nonomuraea gerenzanensis]UBU11484.1 DUF4407 domain-containing protein [Nonomuraea gerenzanensis]SBO99970.1 hypothetical protein BN4615_P9486 [Nonomuraea gerenzanensis]
MTAVIDREQVTRAPGRHRPPFSRRHGIGPALRGLIGVREDVLDWVPEEGPRLTRTGAIVVCTAVLAAVSLWIALSQFVQAGLVASIAGAALWGVVICVIDSWLIASSHGVIGPGRVYRLLPRLLIALVLGFLISEPLTLKVFESAVTTQIAAGKLADERALRDAYRNCHPEPTPGVDCRSYQLNLVHPDRRPLDRAIADLDAFTKQVNPLLEKEMRGHEEWSKECRGDTGKGMSGIPGEGKRCGVRDKHLRSFRAEFGLDAKKRELATLRTTVRKLTKKFNADTAAYHRDVQQQIDLRLAAERAKHAAIPGVLERFEALKALAALSWTVWWAHLLLAGMLILIDCLPVLSKLLSKPGAYDRRLAAQLAGRERSHENDLRLNERLRTGEQEARLHREETRIKLLVAQEEHTARLAGAAQEAERRQRMDELIAQVKAARTGSPGRA